MSRNSLTGRKVYADYGPSAPQDVGHIMSDSPDDDGHVKISWDENNLGPYYYITTVHISTIHDGALNEGWTPTNDNPIGIFYDSD